jgi:hypothetical protein
MRAEVTTEPVPAIARMMPVFKACDFALAEEDTLVSGWPCSRADAAKPVLVVNLHRARVHD